MILSFFLCGWEERNFLLNMTKMKFSKCLAGLMVVSNKKRLNVDEQNLYDDC